VRERERERERESIINTYTYDIISSYKHMI